MTVTSTTTSVTYAGNGSTTAFSVTFKFYELEVIAIDADGVETVQTETTHYTVSGGEGSPGTVTMLVAPASGTSLLIRRATSLLQEIAFTFADSFPEGALNEGFDRAAMRDQDLQRQIDTALVLQTEAAEDSYDFGGNRATNLADGVDDQDAVTVAQLQQTVIDAGAGDVVGPVSAVANDVVLFDGVTGKLVKDGGSFATLMASNLISTIGPETTVASASTVDLSAVSTFRVYITGTTTISSFGTGANRAHLLRFAGQVLVNYTVGTMPNGTRQYTQAGDSMLFTSDSSGAWTLAFWWRQNGGRPQYTESSVASASTCSIGAQTTDLVNVTGTTTITSLGSGTKHRFVWVRFSGALTLTHNATSLILPTGSSITTAAGDIAAFWSDQSDNWRCYVYVRASGAALAGTSTAGTHNIWVPATAMTPATTNGAAWGSVEMTTNKNMFSTLDFDTTTAESAWFSIRMPKSWNEGTVTFVPVWSHAATTTNFGVVWSLAGVAVSDDDAGDAAPGTVQTSTDTGGTTNDVYVGPASSAITIAGTPAAQDVVWFKIARVPSDGSDTMAIDARLHGLTLNITTDADTDT